MLLKELSKLVRDMEVLYGDAEVIIIADNKEYHSASISGYIGEKLLNNCKNPNIVIIKAKTRNLEGRIE